MAIPDINDTLASLEQTLAGIEQVLDVPALKAKAADLEAEASAPDLWDDQANAQRITSQLSLAQGDIRRIEGLRRRLDDLVVLVELAESEDDADSWAEAERELEGLRRDISEMEVRTLLSGEYDAREALITIRSEAGGVDAADWAEMLLRLYTRSCERHGWPFEVYDTSYAEEAGIKSATFAVKAPYAYGTLSIEQGTHRLVRISPFDNQGRRQTSFAAVEVTPVIEQTDHVEIPEDEIRIDVYRSSGPGGQGVNTTDSAVRITHLPTGVVVACQDERSQLQNRERAMKILRARIYEAERERLNAERAATRTAQIGTGARSEKIRTYNYPQSRVTDHRIKFTSHDMDQVLIGALEPFTAALQADWNRQLLEAASADG